MFTFASALSLLLCAAAVVLLICTYRKGWSRQLSLRGRDYDFFSGGGTLAVSTQPTLPPIGPGLSGAGTAGYDLRLGPGLFFGAYDIAVAANYRPRYLLTPLDQAKYYTRSRWDPRLDLRNYDRVKFSFRHVINISFGYPLVVTGILPCAAALRLYRRRRTLWRRSHELCSTCSYDLTANISGICPECGTAVRGSN